MIDFRKKRTNKSPAKIQGFIKKVDRNTEVVDVQSFKLDKRNSILDKRRVAERLAVFVWYKKGFHLCRRDGIPERNYYSLYKT